MLVLQRMRVTVRRIFNLAEPPSINQSTLARNSRCSLAPCDHNFHTQIQNKLPTSQKPTSERHCSTTLQTRPRLPVTREHASNYSSKGVRACGCCLSRLVLRHRGVGRSNAMHIFQWSSGECASRPENGGESSRGNFVCTGRGFGISDAPQAVPGLWLTFKVYIFHRCRRNRHFTYVLLGIVYCTTAARDRREETCTCTNTYLTVLMWCSIDVLFSVSAYPNCTRSRSGICRLLRAFRSRAQE